MADRSIIRTGGPVRLSSLHGRERPSPSTHGSAERADAARNRRRVLDAAAALFAERGVEGVAMDAVARAAGVGKGTLFRRFGDRQGLLVALLDEAERRLQDDLLHGPPRSARGPCRRPPARVPRGLVALLEARGEIVRASEQSSPGARLRTAAYAGWHLHVTVLLESSGPTPTRRRSPTCCSRRSRRTPGSRSGAREA